MAQPRVIVVYEHAEAAEKLAYVRAEGEGESLKILRTLGEKIWNF